MKVPPRHVDMYTTEREQTNTTYTIRIKLPSDIKPTEIKLDRYKAKNKIDIHYSDELPVVCGILHAPITTINRKDSSEEIVITLTKTEPGEWPCLVSYTNFKKGVTDPQSLLELFLHYASIFPIDRKCEQAILKAVHMSYPPAVCIMVNQLVNSRQLSEENIALLQDVIEQYKSVMAADTYSNLVGMGLIPPPKAISVLRKGISIGSQTCALMLGIMKSPVEEPHGSWEDPKEAFEIFTNLNNVPIAKYGLGMLLVKGQGCEQDIKRGLELINEARSTHPELPIPENIPTMDSPVVAEIPHPTPIGTPIPTPIQTPEQEDSILNKLSVAGTVLAVAGVAAYGIYRALRNRK